MKKLKTIIVVLVILFNYNLQAQIPGAGLVGYFPFTGNAKDASPSGNTGIVTGATFTTNRFGNANSAYNFDGVNDFITLKNISAYNLSSYTISLWFKYGGAGTAGKVHWELINKNATTSGLNDPFSLYVYNPAVKNDNFEARMASGKEEAYSKPVAGAEDGKW